MEVSDFKILPIDVTFFYLAVMFKRFNELIKNEKTHKYYRFRWLKG